MVHNLSEEDVYALMLEVMHDVKHEIVHAVVEDMYSLVLEVMHTSCGMYTCRTYGPASKTGQIVDVK